MTKVKNLTKYDKYNKLWQFLQSVTKTIVWQGVVNMTRVWQIWHGFHISDKMLQMRQSLTSCDKSDKVWQIQKGWKLSHGDKCDNLRQS